jgi:hypothetical protein
MRRGLVIVLVLTFAMSSAGTVLCEVDCASARLSHDAAPVLEGGATAMHCHGMGNETARRDAPAQRGKSHRSKKDGGAHQHARNQVIANSRTQFASTGADATPAALVDRVLPSLDIPGISRNGDVSIPINTHSAFTTGVLRI